MSTGRLIDVTADDEVTVVTINHPPANAFAPELLAAAVGVLEELMLAPPGAVVMTGTGSFFSGGADLRVVPYLSAEEQANLARTVNIVFAGWYQFPRPVIAAVNGHAVAGGLIIAMCADHRVVGHAGRFGLTEVKVGIPFPSSAMAVLQGELTPAVCRRLVFGAELFDARTAVELDIFDEIVEDDRVLDRAIEVARQYAALPRSTYEVVKKRLRASALDRGRGQFGGADAASAAVSESARVARDVLDARSE